MSASSEESRARRLLEVGRTIMTLDPGAVLENVLEAARELTGARYAALGVLDEEREELARFLWTGLDEGAATAIGDLPRGHGVLGVLIEEPRPLRLRDVGAHPRSSGFPAGHPPMKSFLGVPIVIRGQAWGNLYLTERPGGEFTASDEEAAVILAEWAAIAIDNARRYETSERRRGEGEEALRGLRTATVAMAQSVRADRLRSSLAAADAERRRWARELHDETLQGLGGLRLLLASALRREELAETRQGIREAVEHIEHEIENLRAIITDLRPAALDELGLAAALEALVDRYRDRGEFTVVNRLDLRSLGADRLEPELETTVYRLVQEALTNAAKHANAGVVSVAVVRTGGEITIEVRDDGLGFDPEDVLSGFGLEGMRERVGLAGGKLRIESGTRGTVVRACVPARPIAAAEGSPSRSDGAEVDIEAARSDVDQAAS
ncbi:MAG TPA: GAF domain-containing sensor histidine kinase [Solirubrobacteraceae bacterium]|jgi:signal transduction histidine kinase|nr:GAF domain-containing sensor histidine kinase [Solirubrobacteraceae bacterium]